MATSVVANRWCNDEVRTRSGVSRRCAPMTSKIPSSRSDRRPPALALSINGRLERSPRNAYTTLRGEESSVVVTLLLLFLGVTRVALRRVHRGLLSVHRGHTRARRDDDALGHSSRPRAPPRAPRRDALGRYFCSSLSARSMSAIARSITESRAFRASSTSVCTRSSTRSSTRRSI
jgi:hypothetical protein